MIPEPIDKSKIILTCPWCGCNTLHLYLVGNNTTRYRIWCGVCDAAGPLSPTKDQAISKWNNQQITSVDELAKFRSKDSSNEKCKAKVK